MTDLLKQVDRARLTVQTDSYPMSIGELVNLYDDGELDIHPEFQRIYRWSESQKSCLIESILLGIPLPSIFVAQSNDGVWDVVDGLQRISTILSFMGKLKDENDNDLQPLRLIGTKYLPALEGKTWDGEGDDGVDVGIKRMFKREKIDIKIIKRESKSDTKYELFQRLNTGGTKLSDQEVRNCILIMINKKSYYWIKELSDNFDFNEVSSISDKQKKECYAFELIIRFFLIRHLSKESMTEYSDVEPYLTGEMLKLFSVDSGFDYNSEKSIFEKSMKALNESLSYDAFKKYNHIKGRHEGAFSLPVYEALSAGLSKLVEENKDGLLSAHDLKEKAKELTNIEEFKSTLDSRKRPLDRTEIMYEIGRKLFDE